MIAFKTYIRRHGDGQMLSVTRGLRPTEALAEFRRLLARDDLSGDQCAAVLRDDLTRRTLLYSRFDGADQRLLPTDQINFESVFMADNNADDATRAIVAARNPK